MRPFLMAVLLVMFSALAEPAAANGKADYKIGDRLMQAPSSAASGYKDTDWESLVPKDWNPLKELKALNFRILSDADPRAAEALRKMREIWDSAPVEPSMKGERIRIAGFMVPLERGKGDLVTEFLLVPYFGACIHVPPPPANQIIHVTTAKPLKSAQAMDAFWVSGTMDIAHTDSVWGASGYQMKADIVTPYTEKP
jgi:hypothetical protein